MKIAITGANGYIGQRLVRAARIAGCEVLALSRRPITQAGIAWQFFDFADCSPLVLSSDVTAVFHLAANTQQILNEEQVEYLAAQRIINASCAIGARFVFVSSQVANQNAPTAYGLMKWKIECATLTAGGTVIRPGLVYGGPEYGLFGVLCRLVRRMPILPIFLPIPMVQPVHVDDLAAGLLACLGQSSGSIFCVAASKSVGFSAFLNVMAHSRTKRWPIFVPVPKFFIYVLIKLLGPELSDKFGLSRLLSLFTQTYMNTANDLQSLSLTLRPMHVGMTRSGCERQALIREGRTFLTYILRMKPSDCLVRRYVRAIETLRNTYALRLPKVMLAIPVFLGLIDGAAVVNKQFRNELDWRLNATLTLAEASPQGALRFLSLDKQRGWLSCGLMIIRSVLSEICRRIAQILFSPCLFLIGRRGLHER